MATRQSGAPDAFCGNCQFWRPSQQVNELLLVYIVSAEQRIGSFVRWDITVKCGETRKCYVAKGRRVYLSWVVNVLARLGCVAANLGRDA